MEEGSCRDWAREYFGGLELGDARLTARAVEMACTAAGRPRGRVLDVYQTSASRQGAYDFLENAAAKGAAMVDGIGLATASGSQGHSHVLVSVDGSSLNIVDRAKNKGFGVVGNANKNARGLKVVTSYALQPDGTPLGVLDQQWWLRAVTKKDRAWRHRTTAQKETRYFNQALEQCARRLEERAPDTRAWFLLDRESDRRATLDLARGMTQHWFTIRSNHDRRVLNLRERSGALNHRRLFRNAKRLQSLIFFKRKYKKQTETISDDMPTLSQAVSWLAEIGGYVGPRAAGGPPGSITIRRGLEHIRPGALIFESMASENLGKKR